MLGSLQVVLKAALPVQACGSEVPFGVTELSVSTVVCDLQSDRSVPSLMDIACGLSEIPVGQFLWEMSLCLGLI